MSANPETPRKAKKPRGGKQDGPGLGPRLDERDGDGGGAGGAPSLTLARSSVELKLDLACGQNVREGFEGVDLYAPQAKHKVDLMRFPWPWADASVDELNCSHFVEHLPLRDVEARDLLVPAHAHLSKDFLFAFFDECYRILKPEAFMTVACPSVRSERAFQDPTHRRFIAQATFFYLAVPERRAMGLSHYNVTCDFEGNVLFTHDAELGIRAAEYQQRVFKEAWNVIQDYVVKLKAIKPART